MSKKILGIDVGGTKIAAGLVDRKGRVSAFRRFPTSQTRLAKQLVDIIGCFQGFVGIGIGMPGQVTPAGEVVHLPNIRKFKQINLKQVLERRFKTRVVVNNDADCFAFAEANLGFGKKYHLVAGVILGTGIGLGMVINNKIYMGHNGMSGEIGRFPMINNRALEEYVRKAGPFKTASQASRYLKLILSYIVLSFNPEIIILGGGWAYLPGMEKICKQCLEMVEKYSVNTLVKVSKLRHAGLIGAALPLLIK